MNLLCPEKCLLVSQEQMICCYLFYNSSVLWILLTTFLSTKVVATDKRDMNNFI